MHFEGILVGAAAFLIIGILHPIVVTAEYHLGAHIWPIFLVVGLASLGLSLFLSNWVLASIAGVFGFACLWTIRELHEQEQRVARGWFPRKPDRG